MFLSRSITSLALAAATLLSLGPAAPLSAQSCLGVPAGSGDVAFHGERNRRGVTTSYGGEFHANLGGTASLGAGFAVDTFDDLPAHGFTTHLSAAMPRDVRGFSICPAFDLTYSEVDPGENDVNDPLHSVVLSPGVGLGLDLPLGDRLSLGFHARPAALLVLGEHSRVRGGEGSADPKDPLQIGATVGALVQLDRMFFGIETARRTPSDSGGTLLLRAGILR